MLNAPWATDAGDCGPCATGGDGPDPAPFLSLASEILYDLTEGAYPGVGTDTIRPPATCRCWTRWRPGGEWWDLPVVWAGRLAICGCSNVSEVVLPGWPVQSVSEVRIDGAVVDVARYRVDDHRRLVFQPDVADSAAPRSWPLLQRAELPAGAAGTWAVTYTWGTDPPPGGVQAAQILACEIAVGCSTDPDVRGACRLPRNAVAVSRKNTSTVMADPEKLREAGETGIPEVDMWIRADRWGRQHRGGAVLAPRSVAQHRRKTS